MCINGLAEESAYFCSGLSAKDKHLEAPLGVLWPSEANFRPADATFRRSRALDYERSAHPKMSRPFFVSIVARPADVITEKGSNIIAPSGATAPSTCSITCDPIVTLLTKNRTLSVHELSAMHMFVVPSAVAIPREKSRPRATSECS
jgi:hypothetical protein